MPRNSSGTYTLPIGAFSAGGLIKASDHNSNYSDIATALTQSLATTGVSSMTGPIKAAAGAVGAPSYTFASDAATGFWLAGTHQIGWTANGSQGATFNDDLSVTWAGGATWAGNVTYNGTATLNGNVLLNATTYTFGAGAVSAWWQGIGALVEIGEIIDGGGSVVTTGQKGQIHIPFPMTIQKWWVMGDESGSVTIDILRANDNVPSTSIVGSGTAPNLSSSQFNSSAPSGWTATTLAKDDFISFDITGSPASVQRVSVYLTCQRTG